MKVRAVVLRHPGVPVAIEEVELDPPRPTEVLVRVAAAGVCHSDVRHADGELGRSHAYTASDGEGGADGVGRRVGYRHDDHLEFAPFL